MRDIEIEPSARLEHLSPGDFVALRGLLRVNPALLSCFQGQATDIDIRLDPEAERLLFAAQLVRVVNGVLTPSFRFHALDDLLVTTDFPNRRTNQRVFPWSDEAERLLRYLHESYHPAAPPRRVMNMCAGAGTVALALARRFPRARVDGVDNNPRAVEVASFNAAINADRGEPRVRFSEGDLFTAVSDDSDAQYDLIVADPPFALQPDRWAEYNHSAGGSFGDNVMKRLFSQVRRHLAPGGRFVCLAYGLGDATSPTRLVELVRDHLCAGDEQPANKLIDLRGVPLWRFKEHKRIRSPMSVRYMAIRCGDPYYLIHDHPEGVEEYVEWIESTLIERHRYSHLHYMIVNHKEGERP